MKQDFAELQKDIGYRFSDLNLLRCAFLHSSADMGDNYERLEFLGDAVLELVISELLYERLPSSTEGELTKTRAALVNEGALASVARNLKLGGYLMLGRGERNSGGQDKPSILADAVEALFGALYLDSGLDQAKKTAEILLGDSIDAVLSGGGFKDYKTKLQEYYHKKGTNDIKYIVFKEEGPPHERVFHVKLFIDGKDMAIGEGSSKKNAEQNAAEKAYAEICAERK